MEYRKHLQAFIDRWRYNANRDLLPSAQYTARYTGTLIGGDRPLFATSLETAGTNWFLRSDGKGNGFKPTIDDVVWRASHRNLA